MPDGTRHTAAAAHAQDERSVSELVFDVAEKSSSLVREEIELAKTEISEKVGKLLRGSVVGVAAGVFAFLALILIMEGVAWLLAEEVFDGNAWPGFFVEAALFLLIAAGAGFFAYRSVQAGAPPMPEQAIEEAKLTKETLESGAKAGERMSAHPEPARRSTAGVPGRSAAQIRRDIDLQRRDLGSSVEILRGRVTELTDWRRQALRAPLAADRRRRDRRLRDRRPDDAAPPPLALRWLPTWGRSSG